MNFNKIGLKILVLGGGISNEHQVSLWSSENVYNSLINQGIQADYCLIDKDFVWHQWNITSNKSIKTLNILPTNGEKSDLIKLGYDLVFNCLHGSFGEDGGLQTILDLIGIKYTGSNAMSSMLTFDKQKTFELIENSGMQINLPETQYFIKTKNTLPGVFNFPLIIKISNSGSTIGVQKIDKYEQIKRFLEDYPDGTHFLIQEYISGREFTVPVIGSDDNDSVISLPVGEIVSETFFDFEAKYQSKETQEIFPANLTKYQTESISDHALQIHELFECEGITRSDFIYDELNDKFYFLEINTCPGMTSSSLCPKSAKAFGWSFDDLICQIVNEAI